MRPTTRFALTTAVLLALGLGVYWLASEKGSGISAPLPPDDKQRLSQKTSPGSASGSSPSSSSETAPANSALVSDTASPSANAPASTGPKKSVDLTASASETPPWPEGPKLYAEVETATTRFINLRPNDFGLMPQLKLAPGEALKVTLYLPESEEAKTTLPGQDYSGQDYSPGLLYKY